ncbi:hypothetical protein PROFUN_16912, partial [Planoprotostelium fungivorum]
MFCRGLSNRKQELVAKESGHNALSSSFVGAARLFLFLCGS